jgi:hypothetical protein
VADSIAPDRRWQGQSLSTTGLHGELGIDNWMVLEYTKCARHLVLPQSFSLWSPIQPAYVEELCRSMSSAPSRRLTEERWLVEAA